MADIFRSKVIKESQSQWDHVLICQSQPILVTASDSAHSTVHFGSSQKPVRRKGTSAFEAILSVREIKFNWRESQKHVSTEFSSKTHLWILESVMSDQDKSGTFLSPVTRVECAAFQMLSGDSYVLKVWQLIQNVNDLEGKRPWASKWCPATWSELQQL